MKIFSLRSLPTAFLLLCASLAASPATEDRVATPGRTPAASDTRLQRSTNLPLVEVQRHGKNRIANVSAIFDRPYTQVVHALSQARNVCEIAPLHFNIKACTHEKTGRGDRLSFYSGRKHYQSPDEVEAYPFLYRSGHKRHDLFEVRLLPEGKARDHAPEPVVLVAMPLPGNRTSLDVRFSYRDTFWVRLATEGYFATLGQGKKGFSIVGTDAAGRPVYIDGVAGAMERNAARYYFALDAFLATNRAPEHERFERRLDYWFGLTETYRAQLHEMDRDTYLGHKRRERQHQLKLQEALDSARAG